VEVNIFLTNITLSCRKFVIQKITKNISYCLYQKVFVIWHLLKIKRECSREWEHSSLQIKNHTVSVFAGSWEQRFRGLVGTYQ